MVNSPGDVDTAASDDQTEFDMSLDDTSSGIVQTVWHGHPAAELFRTSEDFSHGQLVMAAHRCGCLRRRSLERVISEVTQRSKLSIMVVPSVPMVEYQTEPATV